MRITTLLLLDDDGTWRMRPAGESGHWQTLPPDPVSVLAARRGCAVLVPSAPVLLTRARVARMSAHRRRQAVPFALEDELAEDVERLSFALGVPEGDDHAVLPVAVVATPRLARWESALESAGARTALVTPDVLALPWAADTWTVLLDGDRARVRLGRQSGFAIERASLRACLGAALAAAGAPPASVHVYAAPAAEAQDVVAFARDAGIAITAHRDRDRALDWMGAGLDPDGAINLRHASPGTASGAPPVRLAWTRTAALLALLSVVHLGVAAAEHRRAQARLDDLRSRTAQVFERAYPGEPVPARPRARVERDLVARTGGAGDPGGRLLAVLAPAARRLAEVPGWELQRIDYRDGRLDVALRVSGAAALERVQRALASDPALSVERLSASATTGSAEALLRIAPAAGRRG